MIIIEINALENGAHRNQSFNGVLPDGWAVVPDTLVPENFPFGEVTVEEVNSKPTVVEWKPLPMPEPEPVPEPEVEPDVWDELDAAYQEGVDSV